MFICGWEYLFCLGCWWEKRRFWEVVGGLWGRKDEGFWIDLFFFCGFFVCGVRGWAFRDGNYYVFILKEMGFFVVFVNEVVFCYIYYEYWRGEIGCVLVMNGMYFMINNMWFLLSFLSRKIDLFFRGIRSKRNGGLSDCEGN